MLPGNLVAFGKLLQVHDKDAKLFLAPPRTTSKKIVMANLLSLYTAVYLPGWQELGATLARKFFHSEELDKTAYDQFFKELCDVDKHSVPTGKAKYKISKKEAEAQKALLVFRTMLGEPVPWPSDEELAAGKKASIARLQSFSKQRKSVEDEDGEHEDCDEEYDGEEDKGDSQEEEDEGDECGEDEEMPPGAAAEGRVETAPTEGVVAAGEAAEERVETAPKEGVVAAGEAAEEKAKAHKGEEEHVAEDDDQMGVGTGEAEGKGVQAPEEDSKGDDTLTLEEQAWALEQFMKTIDKKGLPKDHRAPKSFFEALRLGGKTIGKLSDSVTVEGLEAFITAEQQKLQGSAQAEDARPPPAATPKPSAVEVPGTQESTEPTRKRKKISMELDNWVVNTHLASPDGDKRCHGTSWFKKLKVIAINEKRMAQDTCTAKSNRSSRSQYSTS